MKSGLKTAPRFRADADTSFTGALFLVQIAGLMVPLDLIAVNAITSQLKIPARIRWQVWRSLGCAALMLIVSAGCPKVDSTESSSGGKAGLPNSGDATNNAPSQFSDDLDAAQILAKSRARYATANAYSDAAVLYLNYNLEGRPIQEPHPFSTAWDSQNRWAAKIFNSRIYCDGRRLSCYVFDIDSANLDNQQLFLPVSGEIPLEVLYRDPIVRHFLGGYAELPLDESQKTQSPKLIPPPISLLTRQLSFAWIQNAEVVERLPDAKIDDRLCYVVRSLADDTTADIWIDQQTLLLTQISLPLQLMIRQVITSGEISDVEMLLRFHQAVVDPPSSDKFNSLFATTVRPDIKPVQRFVSIPDSLPSEQVGETAPNFTLFRMDGTTVDRSNFEGKTSALLWLGGDASLVEAGRFADLAKTFSTAAFNDTKSGFHFAAIYSDGELAKPGAGAVTPNADLQMVIDATQIDFFYDAKMAASSRMMIKAVPTVVVLDKNLKVQFARALSDDQWAADLKAALDRVAAGEDVASEMRNKYDQYLNDYYEQLTAVSAAKIAGVELAVKVPVNSSTDPKSGLHSNSQTTDNAQPLKELKPKLEWEIAELQRPGNIYIDRSDSTPKILVFDGWRTIVEVNTAGRVVASHELDLPAETAVSCLRMVPLPIKPPTLDSSPPIQWAAFHVKGRQVFLFDKDWKRVAAVPDIGIEHDGIRDAMFTSDEPESAADLLVAFDGEKGVYRLQIGNGQAKRIIKQNVRTMTRAGDDMFYVTTDGFSSVAAPQKSVPAITGLTYHRLSISPPELPSTSCLIASELNQNWFACGFSPEGKINWQQPIGSQLFENEIEPVAFGKLSASMAMIAVADAENRINLFSHDGVFVGQVRTKAAISGLAVLEVFGVSRLIASSGASLQCWRLE